MDGAAGNALLFGYLFRATGEARFRIRESEWLQRAAASVEIVAAEPSLFRGYAGVAFVRCHLAESTRALGVDDLTTRADEKILALLSGSRWRDAYDLVDGLVGIGVYALERLPRPAAVAAVSRVVEQLDALSVKKDGGLTWHTPLRHVPPERRAALPGGYYDVGVAHGVGGVVSLLARVVAAGVRAAEARRLLEGAVVWLCARGTEAGDSRFPYWHVPGGRSGQSRAAWCYGDPGIAAALMLAARGAGVPDWEQESRATALRAASRAPESSGVSDAGFCHGAAGLGHVFNRLYQQTGLAELRTAATYWLSRAIDLSELDDAAAGATNRSPGARRRPPGAPDTSFLTGAAGTGLVLLAAATAVEPAWDRVFLLSDVRRNRPQA